MPETFAHTVRVLRLATGGALVSHTWRASGLRGPLLASRRFPDVKAAEAFATRLRAAFPPPKHKENRP